MRLLFSSQFCTRNFDSFFFLCLYLISTIFHLLLPYKPLLGLPLLQLHKPWAGCSKPGLSWPLCFSNLPRVVLVACFRICVVTPGIVQFIKYISLTFFFCLLYSLFSLTGISPTHIASYKNLDLQCLPTVWTLFISKLEQVSSYVHLSHLVHTGGYIVLHIKSSVSFICAIKIFGLG